MSKLVSLHQCSSSQGNLWIRLKGNISDSLNKNWLQTPPKAKSKYTPAIKSQTHCMHCTCTTHKTCHLSLKSAGLSLNLCPRNTEIQRCPLMAAASFQVALQKQQCPHGKWLGTGISCKSVHLYGYLVKTFDENVHDVSNARIVFGNLLLQKKPLWIHFFPQERMDRWWSVLIWSRASDDHDSSWICNLQIPKLMTFTDSVNNGKTGVLPWNWNWGDNSPILIIFHLFFFGDCKRICVTNNSPKNNQASLLHQAFPIEHSNAMVSFQPPEFGLVEGWLEEQVRFPPFLLLFHTQLVKIWRIPKTLTTLKGTKNRQLKKSCPTNMHAVSQRKS